jgi:alpha-1,2-mannosyltransferase
MTSDAQKRNCFRWAAWIVAFLIFAIICGDVIRKPTAHTTMPTYRLASQQWWQGTDVYSQNDNAGFLYFPQAAVLFTPFEVLPLYAGELAWRIAVFGLFLYALMRLNAFFPGDGTYSPQKRFFLLALLAIPSSMASLRNAQFDLPLAALIILTAAEIAAERWTSATVWICLAIALKPLAVVPLLLFGALYWKFIPRLAVGLLIVLALPLLHWNPAFAAHEYARCVETLAWATKADQPKFSDLAALLAHIGIYPIPDMVKTATRVLCALLYLGLGAMAVRRLSRTNAAWAIGALSADYLMLFNPRTETCSYVFLGAWVASLAVANLQLPTRKWLGYLLAFAALGFACDAFPKLGAFSIHDLTDRWYKPLLALLFLPVLVEFIFRGSRRCP